MWAYPRAVGEMLMLSPAVRVRNKLTAMAIARRILAVFMMFILSPLIKYPTGIFHLIGKQKAKPDPIWTVSLR
jgi:hypothetical protein